jgi:chromosome segregation protein
MRLKRVRIIGFKTFADKTEFGLEGDFTAVVGPNGCGKSNLVDAILWGLGEGNSRALRAGTNQDVIFNGSPKRKAVGYAEVTLIFDNEDGALPVDTSEVVISRRVTRGGDSDYSINKRNCRLRDIHELLADSGLGRSGYAIVGQKEIDAALAASPEDRRGWVDEAAGVQRYRARKVESQRRLNQARDHLSRTEDILIEIESQRGPLRLEAERALRYKQLAASLRDVEVGLLVRDAAESVREIKELELKLESGTRLALEESAKCEALESEAVRLRNELHRTEQEFDSLRETLQEAVTTHERVEANLRLAEQRLESLAEQETSLCEDTDSIEERILAARDEAARFEAEEAQAYAHLNELKTALAGADAEAKALRTHLDTVEKELAQAREFERERMKAEAQAAHQADRQRAIQRELNGIAATLPDLERAVSDGLESVTASQKRVDAVTATLKATEGEVELVRQSGRKDDAAVRDALGKKAALEGRIRGIQATIEQHEGLTQGSRAVLLAAEQGVLRGHYTPVGEAIDCDPELGLAIETALGGSLNDLIVDSDQDAKAAIEYLKSNRAGRATFQPIPFMRPFEPTPEFRRLVTERGVIGRASDLVRCEARVRPVIDSLLGRILIVDELDDALRFAKTSGWSRMVTLDGEVIHGSGAVTGGTTKNVAYGIVQRRADLAQLEHELAQTEKLVREHAKREAARSEQIQKLEQDLSGIRSELADLQTDVSDQTRFLRSIQDELESTVKQRDRLQKELAALNPGSHAQGVGRPVAEIEQERDDLLKRLAAKSGDSEQSAQRLQEAEQVWARAQLNRLGAERRYRQAEEDAQLRTNRLANIGPMRDRLGAEIASTLLELEKQQGEIAHLNRKVAELSGHKRALSDQLGQTYDAAKAARENTMALSSANQQSEIARTRHESRKATSLQRLLEEYGLSEGDALALDGTIEIPEDAVTLANRLRRDMRGMGEVNLGAINAYEQLTARFEELNHQFEDISEGIAQIETAIRELDELTRDRFITTFERVQEAFRNVFQAVFPDGEGELVLTDADHILDTGIDIDVRLPGKRKQPLPLLSGGERSLCAAAFLFALLRVKPSPLVILDEVDAPLDGRNVERFSALLQQFFGTTQFIVITHNPVTIESAPVWLGVTMNEPGVSTLVPAKLKDWKETVAGFASV